MNRHTPLLETVREWLGMLAPIGAVSAIVTIGAFAWANHTQYHLMSEDIPAGLICIKDTHPDAYYCETDWEGQFWLDWEAPNAAE